MKFFCKKRTQEKVQSLTGFFPLRPWYCHIYNKCRPYQVVPSLNCCRFLYSEHSVFRTFYKYLLCVVLQTKNPFTLFTLQFKSFQIQIHIFSCYIVIHKQSVAMTVPASNLNLLHLSSLLCYTKSMLQLCTRQGREITFANF